jgi:hypothetical protein
MELTIKELSCINTTVNKYFLTAAIRIIVCKIPRVY